MSLIPTNDMRFFRGDPSAEDYFRVGEVVEIPGKSAKYVRLEPRYLYGFSSSTCPACGSFGIPWRGWFECDGCSCIALVSTGEAFLRVEDTP